MSLIDSQKSTLETLNSEISNMKNNDLNNLKLEWDKLQKDISSLDKDVTLKSNTFSSLQKQIGES